MNRKSEVRLRGKTGGIVIGAAAALLVATVLFPVRVNAAQEDEFLTEKPVMNSVRDLTEYKELKGGTVSAFELRGETRLYITGDTTIVMDVPLTLQHITNVLEDGSKDVKLTIQGEQQLTLDAGGDWWCGINAATLSIEGAKVEIKDAGLYASTLNISDSTVKVSNIAGVQHDNAIFSLNASVRNSTLEVSSTNGSYDVLRARAELSAQNSKITVTGGEGAETLLLTNAGGTVSLHDCETQIIYAKSGNAGKTPISTGTLKVTGGSLRVPEGCIAAGNGISLTDTELTTGDTQTHGLRSGDTIEITNSTVTTSGLYADNIALTGGKVVSTTFGCEAGGRITINGDLKTTINTKTGRSPSALGAKEIIINGGNVEAQDLVYPNSAAVEAYDLNGSSDGTITIASSLKILTPANGKVTTKYSDENQKNYMVIVTEKGAAAGHVIIGSPVDGGGSSGNTGSNKEGWQQDSKGYWYRNADGTYPKNAWKQIGGKWYHFDASGYMQTGWQKISGKWYYFGGVNDGAMKTGWQKISGKWYYLSSGGDMVTGWVQSGGKWYYMNTSGEMQTGWVKVGNTWYYMNGSGVMQTSWQKVGGKWYYLKSSGAMATGWTKVGSKWYYMNGSGVMMTGWQKIGAKWYYLNGGGDMVTGWKKVGGTWYYFENSGTMLAGTSRNIGGKTYRFNAGGACMNP